MPDQGLTTDQLDALDRKAPSSPPSLPHSGRLGDFTAADAQRTVAHAHPLSGVLGAMNRPNEATLARMHGRGFWHTLFHGEPYEQYESDTADTTRRMMGASPQEYANMPEVRRAANEFATQMVTDPLTYLGGTGIMRNALEHAGLRVLPATVRTAAKVAQKTQGGKLADSLKVITDAGGWLHDQMTPGGKPVAHAIRELALKQGAEGMRNAERMTSAAGGSRSVAAHVGAVGKQLLNQTLHGVPPEAQSIIFKAIHDGAIGKLPQQLRPVADRLVEIDRSIPWLLGTKTTRDRLTKLGFVLPPEFRVFDQGPRGIVKLSNFMENHVPLPHELNDAEREAAFASLNKRGGSRDLTDFRSKFFRKRSKEPPSNAFSDPDMVRETWERSFGAAGRAIGGADLRSNLVKIFAQSPEERVEQLETLGKRMSSGNLSREPVKLADIIKQTTGKDPLIPQYEARLVRTGRRNPAVKPDERVFKLSVPSAVRKAYTAQPAQELTGIQPLIRSLEQLGNLGKSTLFTTPFPHQRNIATLLALANPSTFPAAIANYARMRGGLKILGASPSRTSQVLGEAMRAGASGVPNLEQRGLEEILGKGDRVPVLGKVLGPLGKAASKWYGGVGEMLWGWDDAVKKALFDAEKRRFGGDSLRAAASVRRKLVDYSQPTAFQELVRTVAPFATWRTSMPKAVLTSLFEHPEYALGLTRATHGAAAGVPFTGGDGKEYQSSNPLSETNELFTPGEMHKYVRGSLSLTAKAGADVAAHALGLHETPFAYPQLEQNVPVAGQFVNPYGDTPLQKALFMLTGVHEYREPKVSRHRRRRRRQRPPE